MEGIKIFDFNTKQQIHHFENVPQGKCLLFQDHILFCLDVIRTVAVTHDNKYIISCSQDKSIKVFDLHTKQQTHHFENIYPCKFLFLSSSYSSFLDYLTSMAVTSDSRYVISGSLDKSIKVFDLKTKQQVHHFTDAHQSKFISRHRP